MNLALDTGSRTDIGSVVRTGCFAAASLGAVNHAAHMTDWPSRILFGTLGLYAGLITYRLAGPPRSARTSSPALSSLAGLAAVLPLTIRPHGEQLWMGGAWIAAAGALLGLWAVWCLGEGFSLVPSAGGIAVRGPYRAIRHPMTTSLLLIAGGYLPVHFSMWNLAVLGAASCLALALSLAVDRLSSAVGPRARWRFAPGMF